MVLLWCMEEMKVDGRHIIQNRTTRSSCLCNRTPIDPAGAATSTRRPTSYPASCHVMSVHYEDATVFHCDAVSAGPVTASTSVAGQLGICAGEQAGRWRHRHIKLRGSQLRVRAAVRLFLRNEARSVADDLAVDHLGALGLGQHEPHNGERLDGVVPGDVVEDDAGEGLEEGEHAEDDPVGEPLDVVLGLGALERLEREVGGDEKAEEVGEEAGGTVDGKRG
ncbi:hypothetical protein L1887_42173 [Cichorium endivia]|nr:hypothetical protein L1887_42173 [Cichorium endivia]